MVAGTTGRVDDSLKKMFFNPGNSAGMQFPIEYNTQSPIYPEIGQSKSIVKIISLPSDGVLIKE